jgi:hypothetical protein
MKRSREVRGLPLENTLKYPLSRYSRSRTKINRNCGLFSPSNNSDVPVWSLNTGLMHVKILRVKRKVRDWRSG